MVQENIQNGQSNHTIFLLEEQFERILGRINNRENNHGMLFFVYGVNTKATGLYKTIHHFNIRSNYNFSSKICLTITKRGYIYQYCNVKKCPLCLNLKLGYKTFVVYVYAYNFIILTVVQIKQYVYVHLIVIPNLA